MGTLARGLILDVARAAGREPVRVGQAGEYLIHCPLADRHANGDAHPSCRLNPEKNAYYCDPCGEGGGVTKLAELLGVELPGRSKPGSKRKRRRPVGNNGQPAAAELAFISGGPIGSEVQSYFTDKLGKAYVSETWSAFGVLQGQVPSNASPGGLEEAIAFPLPGGGYHVYRYRRAERDERWRFTDGGKPGLIVAGLDRPGVVIIAEGQWDAMRAYGIGFPVATGTGAGIFGEDWGERIADREAAITYDVDPAGRSGSEKVIRALRAHTSVAWIVRLPLSGDPDCDGKDLSDFVALHGAEALRALVANSRPAGLKDFRGCVRQGANMSAAELLEMMREHFPGMEKALHAALSLHAYGCLEGSNRPCAIFLVGPPSSGKTLVVRMCMPVPECPDLAEYVYRCDDFTPASFVSRAANVSPEKLAEIDLLPKLSKKVLVTKELAPIFRGKQDDLTKTFALLTAVLDGDGLVSAGGSVGTRGYSDPIFFCWLGATTPLTKQTWQVMAALGPRILFFKTAAEEPTIGDLVRAQKDVVTNEEYLMRLRVNGFLKAFFERHPPLSILEGTISCSDDACLLIARHARFLARLRAGLSLSESDDSHHRDPRYEPPTKEHEFRLVKTLNRLAKASAVVMGREHVTSFDLDLIRHVALSSAPETRRRVAESLLELTARKIDAGATHPVGIPVGTIAKAINCSQPTARHYAEELQVLGIATYTHGYVGGPEGGMLTLAEDLRALAVPEHTHPLNAFNLEDGGEPR